MHMSRTYKVTYNHGKLYGETNLICINVEPHVHDIEELYTWYCMWNI